MCGICGCLRPGGVRPGDRSHVVSMMRALEHRGPDGDGIWDAGGAILGHRRLAVIDLEAGRQPLFNESGDIATVFNGEIYNYVALRHELARAGHDFRTASDTEVIVHGYEEWGADVIRRLRGMFAIAIWDAPRSRLLLARDRLGIKPLYLHRAASGLVLFASEIKAFFGSQSVPRRPNLERLQEYLAFRTVAGQETLFEGIEELAPGTLVTADGGEWRETIYWSPEPSAAEHPARSRPRQDTARWVEQGRALLDDAVASHLVSDVGLGTITSGGLDSGVVTAIAAQRIAGIDTFCAGFEDPAYDEGPLARALAARLGTRHHAVTIAGADIDRELDRLTWAHDEPLTHPNSVPMHLLLREAKERAGVTVVLSGEGADEVFGGYDWYRTLSRRQALRGLAPLRHLPERLAVGRLAALRRVMHPDYRFTASAVSVAADVRPLASGGGDYVHRRRTLWRSPLSTVEGLFYFDQRTYLPALLQRQDRMSMAAGVEARVPFLDHPLVEWANMAPARVKLLGGERKALLKRIAGHWLPDEIVHRPKIGFSLPLAEWMRPGGALAPRVERLREPRSFARSLTTPAVLDRLLAEHASGTRSHADLLWSLVALDTWGSVFFGDRVQSERLPGAATGRPERAVTIS